MRTARAATREFDVGFMQDVYERPFEIVLTDEAGFPQAHEQTRKVGGHTNGCRIGFDAGGSDRKVSAVIDGETGLLRGGRLASQDERGPAVPV